MENIIKVKKYGEREAFVVKRDATGLATEVIFILNGMPAGGRITTDNEVWLCYNHPETDVCNREELIKFLKQRGYYINSKGEILENYE